VCGAQDGFFRVPGFRREAVPLFSPGGGMDLAADGFLAVLPVDDLVDFRLAAGFAAPLPAAGFGTGLLTVALAIFWLAVGFAAPLPVGDFEAGLLTGDLVVFRFEAGFVTPLLAAGLEAGLLTVALVVLWLAAGFAVSFPEADLSADLTEDGLVAAFCAGGFRPGFLSSVALPGWLGALALAGVLVPGLPVEPAEEVRRVALVAALLSGGRVVAVFGAVFLGSLTVVDVAAFAALWAPACLGGFSSPSGSIKNVS